jgi:hypothetical protein
VRPEGRTLSTEGEEMETFKIVRFVFFDGENEVVRTGLTLDEAREHCKREDTHEAGVFFDGYEAEESYLSGDDWNQERGGATIKIEPESGTALSSHAGVPVMFYSAVA